MRMLILHGPNLNLLGEREPEIYGERTLADLNHFICLTAEEQGDDVEIFQSNHEGELIELIHSRREWADGVVINPGALTHYSYALRDAIEAVRPPVVEVHLSDITSREPFRRISVVCDVCVGQISGLGFESYLKGMKLLRENLASTSIHKFKE